MPIERRDSTTQLRAVLIAVVSVVLAAVLAVAAVRSFSSKGASVIKAQSDARFSVDIATVSLNVAKGGPVLFPDAGTGGQRRPIFVFHEGSDDEKGWVAYVAVPPGAPKDCFVNWDRSAKHLTASCTGTTYPPTGAGLTTLKTEVTKDGQLLIDLAGAKG